MKGNPGRKTCSRKEFEEMLRALSNHLKGLASRSSRREGKKKRKRDDFEGVAMKIRVPQQVHHLENAEEEDDDDDEVAKKRPRTMAKSQLSKKLHEAVQKIEELQRDIQLREATYAETIRQMEEEIILLKTELLFYNCNVCIIFFCFICIRK